MQDLESYRSNQPENYTENDSPMAIAASRAMQEVQGQIIMAKKYPRDTFSSVTSIIRSCERHKLAETAMYSYPRGGQMVTGPSIRLAEVIARSWGNLDFGVRELSRGNGESVVETYCWDLETNVRATRTFTVTHEISTKKQGVKKLTDPRDIYEIVANNGARRLRACILEIIPSDVVQDAIERCEKTIAVGPKNVPFADRLKNLLIAFKDLQVSQEDIETRLGHKYEATNNSEFVSLYKIYTAIKDGVSDRSQWFEQYKTVSEGKTEDQIKAEVEAAKKVAEMKSLDRVAFIDSLKTQIEALIVEAKSIPEKVEYIEKNFGILGILELRKLDDKKLAEIAEKVKVAVPFKAVAEQPKREPTEQEKIIAKMRETIKE